MFFMFSRNFINLFVFFYVISDIIPSNQLYNSDVKERKYHSNSLVDRLPLF